MRRLPALRGTPTPAASARPQQLSALAADDAGAAARDPPLAAECGSETPMGELVARLFDDVRGTQIGDRIRRNSELAQNLVGMRCPRAQKCARAMQPCRLLRRSAPQWDAAGASARMRMMGFDDQLIGNHLRIANHFLAGQHRRAWNVVGARAARAIARRSSSRVLPRSDRDVPSHARAGGQRVEARIVDPFGMAERFR